MANEFNASYFCFTQARCRLCQFPVRRGDVIIAAVEEGFATEFKLPHFGDFWDRGLHIKFHTCFLKKCRVREEATVCYHVDCYRDRLYSITPIFLAGTEFSFTPFPEEERRRAEFNRQLLACKLEQMDFGTQSLPYELWLIVARHLVRCVPGAWWKNISQGVMPSAITIKGDGLKVRSIESSQTQDLALVGWPTPLPSPPLVVNLATLEPPRDPLDGLRMDFFDCNAPDTVGYSVALVGRAIAGFVAHKKGEADVQSVGVCHRYLQASHAAVCDGTGRYWNDREGNALSLPLRLTSSF
ncbi:hypothetical protein CGCTS75_v014606 [Colletotrichum tropicale]|nr:hypothetical protein CGCTS75_v014606 [Colletotrichum tropicale]